MTFHLFANLITAQGVAANNRGENEGNRSTLPKVFWNQKLHVSVSAEAIRWAIRYYWQNRGLPVNREWKEDKQVNVFTNPRFDPDLYIDDDILGFMLAKPGKGEEVSKRRGALEVTRAVSLESADKIQITFNSKSGDKGSKAAGTAEKTSIYSTELITTRFQWGMAITPERLIDPERVLYVVEAVTKLANVGGNHARFLYDFSPESVIFRWTVHPCPQILNCFEVESSDCLSAPRLIQLIEVGEIPAEEIWILGGYGFTEEAKKLEQLGVHVFPSIRKGTENLLTRISQNLKITLPEDLAS